jgi:site-specific DNA recombinase
MRAAVYCRVSTLHQKEKGYSLEWQREHMPARAISEGYSVTNEDIYIEAESGTSILRPEFRKMMALIESGHYQAIFVAEKSRLSRIDDPTEAGEIIRMVLKHNCKVFTVNSVFDPSNPEGRFHWMIDDAVNVLEIQKAKQRFKRGKFAKVQQGGYIGGTPPKGYKFAGRDPVTGKMRFEVDEAEAEMIRRMFKLALTGMSIGGIKNQLTEEGYKTYTGSIARRLKNPHYAGYAHNVPNNLLVEENNYLVPIISKDDFWAVQKRFTNPSRSRRARFPLTGILTCGNCDTAMKIGFTNGYRIYVCPSRETGDSCKGMYPKSIPLVIAHQMVLDFIPKFISKYTTLQKNVRKRLAQEIDDPIPQLKKQLSKVEKKLDNLIALFSEAPSSKISDKIKELQEEEKVISRQIEAAAHTIKPVVTDELEKYLQELSIEDEEDLETIVPTLFKRLYFKKLGHRASGKFRITSIITAASESYQVRTTGTFLKPN